MISNLKIRLLHNLGSIMNRNTNETERYINAINNIGMYDDYINLGYVVPLLGGIFG